jgi:hypothetical protein
VVKNRLDGVESVRIAGKGLELESLLLKNGTPMMRLNGEPAKMASIKIGDSVNLPVFNGRGDYRLVAVKHDVAMFTGDLWYWACVGQFLIHGTEHLALVMNDDSEGSNGQD